MAKLSASNYQKPAPVEKPNPYIDAVKEYTDKGVDALFDVSFTADEYKAEKLLIQKAVNVHGFSAREISTDFDEKKPGPVHSVFAIRPPRKRNADGSEQTDAQESAEEATTPEVTEPAPETAENVEVAKPGRNR